jgi:hypothetical protein
MVKPLPQFSIQYTFGEKPQQLKFNFTDLFVLEETADGRCYLDIALVLYDNLHEIPQLNSGIMIFGK